MIELAGHPLLSPEAQALDSTALVAHTAMAERALGCAGYVFSSDQEEEAAAYVALQVNLQLQHAARGDVVAESKGSQSFTYAQVNGQRVVLDAFAASGIQELMRTTPPGLSSTELMEFRW